MIIKLNNGQKIQIDPEDTHLISGKAWLVHPQGYVFRSRYNGRVNKKTVSRKESLHRLVMGAEPGQAVDHINHDKLDNRKANLRLVTHSQNMWNQLPSKGRKFKGIFETGFGSYQVKIGIYGRQYYLGTYRDAEEAKHIYDCVAIQLHGDYALLNGERA